MHLVSGVMPTRGRRSLASHALESFLSQTYEAKELVILDDADDPSFPDGVAHPLVRYHRLETRLTIPEKRNRVNALAAGEIIAHFDSDDWSAATRLAEQVATLETCGKQVTGFHSILFYDETTGAAHKYNGFPDYACGTSLVYWHSWMEHHSFPEHRPIASDNRFVREANDAHQLHAIDGGSLIVARIHADNSSPKTPHKYGKAERSTIPEEFFRQCQPVL